VRPLWLGPAVLLALGCRNPPRPWDLKDAEPPTPPTPASSQGPTQVAVLDASPDDAGRDDVEPKNPVRIGGPWVRCYGNFRASGDPVKDVTRLSILCGPENGMRRLSTRAVEGSVTAGGAPVSESFDARRGDCYRVFAVAEPSVADLDVVVRSSRGSPIAADHGEDGWPIVQPDRPFCALEDDRYTFEVSAKRGGGRFAAEVWVLRAPRAP
jgi:hypothetical protein